tara:strand:- start:1251 stop:2522 length:1272 start_codon:yes stop_codon:yes gene_type:complete
MTTLTPSKNLYRKLQRQYSRKINLDLKRINLALKKLGNIHKKINNPINIIGSDGKYSTLKSLQYIIEANKEKVSTFTSPHLYDVRHRFWLKNKFISIDELNKYINIIKKLKIKLTLFEVLTLSYYLAASKLKKISYSLCESGLLFKGDSTRVWDSPKCQIITNINKQHLEWVKPKTLEEICKQKVGYLSNNTTIYVGKQKAKTMKIIKRILKKNKSKKSYYGDEWSMKKEGDKRVYADKKGKLVLKSNNIFSNGIWENVGLAIKVARDFNISNKTILKAIPKINFEGRLQYIKKGKLKKLLNKNEKLLVDGCHSEASAINLSSYLSTINQDIYAIWGMQKNKQPHLFIKHFKKKFKKIIAIKIPEEPNTCNPVKLKKIANVNGFKCEIEDDIKLALKKISNKKPKLIVILGSLYLAGSILYLN